MKEIRMNLKFSLELFAAVLVLILGTTVKNVSSLPSSTTKSSIHENETVSTPPTTKTTITTSKYPPTDANNDVISFGIRSFTVKVSANERNYPTPTPTSSNINPNDNRNVINQASEKNERPATIATIVEDANNDEQRSKLFNRKFDIEERPPQLPSPAPRQKTKLDDFFPSSKNEDFRPILKERTRKTNKTKNYDSKINNRADTTATTTSPTLPSSLLLLRGKTRDAASVESIAKIKIDDSSKSEAKARDAEISNSSSELISRKKSAVSVPSATTDDLVASQKADTTFKQLRDIENIDIRIMPQEKSRLDLGRILRFGEDDLRILPPEKRRFVSFGDRSASNLDCSISNFPQDATIWHGNATHVLNFPVKKHEECGTQERTSKCQPETLSWDASSDIQSGDVLIVEIDDQYLISPISGKETETATATLPPNNAYMNTVSVYQVTRSGHENCDVTEGELLDITPLNVDDKKLVTLYDKDLTEGLNLLIVVSKLWGEQCVRLKVNMKSDNCGENAECSGKGVCYSDPQMDVYECHCCDGFARYHCEEIDLCSPTACRNGGICLDIAQGHDGNSYQCLCPYGYAGPRCETELDPCKDQQCLNGGTCIRNTSYIKSTNQTLSFRCECAQGFAGPLCQHNLNECESSPCVHGICVNQEDGFRCFCQPGFSGDICDVEYDECFSSPCLNNGICSDQVGGYTCSCTAGYTGDRCHIKIDFCASNPCEDGYRCIDHGDKFSCVCPGQTNNDHNSPDCLDLPRTLCDVNPCLNGGTCWTSSNAGHIGSFYCACRPGFDGKLCEDKYVVDTFIDTNELLLDNNVISFEDSIDTQSSLPTSYLVIIATVAALGILGAMIAAAYFYCNINNNYQKLLRRQCDLMSALKMKKKRVRETFGRTHWLNERKYSNVEENQQQNFIKYKNNQPSSFQDNNGY